MTKLSGQGTNETDTDDKLRKQSKGDITSQQRSPRDEAEKMCTHFELGGASKK